MAELVLILPVWILFLIKFGKAFYVEVRRTSWDLLEALIAVNLCGHVVAFPLSLVLQDEFIRPEERLGWIVGVAFGATIVAACMAGGAVWVFRRLKAKGETRRGVRIVYMILGLLLFPSMVLFPFNLLFGWIVWVPLTYLDRDTEALLMKQRQAERRSQAE